MGLGWQLASAPLGFAPFGPEKPLKTAVISNFESKYASALSVRAHRWFKPDYRALWRHTQPHKEKTQPFHTWYVYHGQKTSFSENLTLVESLLS